MIFSHIGTVQVLCALLFGYDFHRARAVVLP